MLDQSLAKETVLPLPGGAKRAFPSGIGELLRQFSSQDAHPFVQFVKYGLCGVAATIAHQAIFFSLSYTILPAADGLIVDGAPISDEMRYRNGMLNNAIAFLPVVIFVYVINVKWVFTGGKHSRLVEFLLFAGVAAVGNIAGLIGGPMLINWFGIPTWMSQSTFVVTSFLVNFLSRKFFIFKG